MRMFSFVATILLFCATVTRGDGILYRLPADGASVQYDMVVKLRPPGTTVDIEIKGSVRLSSVGVETVADEKCRWIEFRTEILREGQNRTILTKALIPEKHLGQGKNPIDHVVRAWYKAVDTEVISVTDIKSAQASILQTLLAGPDPNAVKLDPITIENAKLGKLECAGERATRDLEFGDTKSKVTFENRLSDKVPFGVLKSVVKFQNDQGGTPIEGEVTLDLTDVGETALTELPNNK
ncbi:MAG: hypothetical protein NT069_34775 [Planctomycetota bacterium]|nr:hypothetical protein [Planctomycetota bacterium]